MAGFDALGPVRRAKIPSGPYQAGFLVGEGGAVLNWYFANLGLTGFVEHMPDEVKNYMALYLSMMDRDARIADLYFPVAGGVVDYGRYETRPNGVGQLSDSDDSYAATFLSLVARYRQVTCDDAWVRANLPRLKQIAANNLLRSQWPNGLVHVFQDAAAYPGAYLEDNAEVYKGLVDFARLLRALGEAAAADEHEAAARRIAQAIQSRLYFDSWPAACPNPAGFAVIWSSADFDAKGNCLNATLKMYPDGVSQVFPQVFGVPLPAAQYAAGWNFLDTRFPNFTEPLDGLPPYPDHDDPWTLLGYAAALDGRTEVARRMLSLTETVHRTDPARVHLNDWGFYRRTQLLLAGQAPY